MKKKVLFAAKLLTTALIFSWVLWKLGPDGLRNLWDTSRSAHALGLFLALLALWTTMMLGATRWHLLLRLQGIRLSFYQVFWMVAVGMFFNAFLVGATGGDVLKAWYITQAAQDRKSPAILSIVIDRLIGLFGLFILASAVVLFHLPFLLGNSKTRPLAFLVISSCAAAILAIALTTQRHRLALLPGWEKFWSRMPGQDLLKKLSDSYDLYGHYPGTMAAALLLSVGVHAGVIFSAWFIGRAIQVQEVGLQQFLLYCPIINTLASIPITVSGLGVREGAFKFFFSGFHGVPEAQSVAISLLFYACTLVMSLICGIFYLLGKPSFATASKT